MCQTQPTAEGQTAGSLDTPDRQWTPLKNKIVIVKQTWAVHTQTHTHTHPGHSGSPWNPHSSRHLAPLVGDDGLLDSDGGLRLSVMQRHQVQGLQRHTETAFWDQAQEHSTVKCSRGLTRAPLKTATRQDMDGCRGMSLLKMMLTACVCSRSDAVHEEGASTDTVVVHQRTNSLTNARRLKTTSPCELCPESRTHFSSHAKQAWLRVRAYTEL